MRISVFTTSICGLALALTLPAAAEPGPTVEQVGAEQKLAPIGLVLEPTAYTIPAGRWLIGAGTFQQTVAGRTGDRQFSIGAYRGVSNNLQLGLFYAGVDTEDNGIDSFFGGSVHWRFVDETKSVPAIAIGGYGYGGDGTGGTLYLVGSKNLMSTVRPGALFLHAGARWDFFDFGGTEGTDNDVEPFVGANLLLMRDLSLNAEWRAKHPWEEDDVMAFGLSYLFSNSWVVSAGAEDAGGGFEPYVGLSFLP